MGFPWISYSGGPWQCLGHLPGLPSRNQRILGVGARMGWREMKEDPARMLLLGKGRNPHRGGLP